MRLIDADAFLVDESAAYILAQSKITDEATRLVNEVVHKKVQMLIADAPTVAVPQWVSVKDRLPDAHKDILVYVKNGSINRTWYDGYGFRNATSKKATWYRPNSVTHWMPLPEPPKEENDATDSTKP